MVLILLMVLGHCFWYGINIVDGFEICFIIIYMIHKVKKVFKWCINSFKIYSG
jgi:hypothetical protein